MGSSYSTISTEFLVSSLIALERIGHPLNSFYDGIKTAGLESTHAGVSLQELLTSFDRLVSATGSHNLSFLLGAESSLSSYGMAGMSAMMQLTYRDTLHAAERLCEVLNLAVTIEVVEYANRFGLRIEENYAQKSEHYRYLVEYIFSSFECIFGYLVGNQASLHSMTLSYSPPSYRKLYHQHFDCPVAFDSDVTEILVHNKYIDTPMALANKCTADLAENHFYKLSPNILLGFSLRKVKKIIYTLYRQSEYDIAKDDVFDVESIGRHLGMSGRTLRRRLETVGTSFGSIVSQVKKELSMKYIREGSMSITDITFELGFCDLSAFSKIFKEWTGMSPLQYRKKINDSY